MDIKKVLNGSVVDFQIENFDLASSDGVEEAILNSLYTDARAEGQKGWWGDFYNDKRATGSRLWTLRNAKQTNETRLLAKQYAQESLQWLIDDNIADKIEVETSWSINGYLIIKVDFYKNNKHRVYEF